MKRLCRFVLELTGWVIGGILIIALVLALKAGRDAAGSLAQTPLSPLASPTQQVKASPAVPLATIPPKPLSATQSAPTPSINSPLPTPTSSSLPTVFSSTATFPAPTAIPITTGSLPPGMKIAYAETDGTTGNTTIWIANVTLATRKQLVTVINKVGYAIEGAVSPDGTKIAYLVISPQASEREARTDGGELWVMNSDGTDLHSIAYQVGDLAMWSPDSMKIAFSRLVALATPKNPQVPFQTELYSVRADGTGQKLLLSDDTAYGINPVGWSSDSQTFYYLEVTLQGQWSIQRIELASGLTALQAQLPYSLIQSFQLSPNGMNLLVTAVNSKGQRSLVNLSMDGQRQEIIASGATGDQPVNQYSAIWSSDSKDLLAHIPSDAVHAGGLQQVDIASNQARPLLSGGVTDGDVFFIPQSWSPDGAWLVLLQYPRLDSFVYLQTLADGSIAQLAPAQSSNWITPLGWIAH